MDGIINSNKIFSDNRRDIFIVLLLVFATLSVFWQVRHHDFINYDDKLYVTANEHVQNGLSKEGIVWAFTTSYGGNWHPLTWLSHMLDITLFGNDPGRHHLTSLLLHLLNTLLLFTVFKKMTADSWRSGFVAALFALHPLHVESVAWVSERKDVLCMFFWMLTMWCYIRYVKQPAVHRYLAALMLFVLGLLSKPMAVTLPFVLLLMDYWPLERFAGPNFNRQDFLGAKLNLAGLVWEKIPFFILVEMSCVATFVAQKQAGAVASLTVFSLDNRIANALISYLKYMEKMIWPSKLAVIYMHPETIAWQQAVPAFLLMVLLFALAIVLIKKKPYLAVGWFWFAGTLVPVIGLVQVGSQSMADRYTYIPLIGLFVIIAWGFPELAERLHLKKAWISCLAAVALILLTAVTWQQIQYWKNSITLFEHVLKVTSENPIAHYNLGIALETAGHINAAEQHYRQALHIKPDYGEARGNLGITLEKQGRTKEAVRHYLKVLRFDAGNARVQNNLGNALLKLGRINEAIARYLTALGIQPDFDGAHNNLGVALLRKGDVKGALNHFQAALQINPDFIEARRNLDKLLRLRASIARAKKKAGP